MREYFLEGKFREQPVFQNKVDHTMSSSSSFTSAASISTSTPPIDILGDGGHFGLGKATKLMFAAASGSHRTLEKVLRLEARVS